MLRFGLRAGLLMAALVVVSSGCGQPSREVANLSGKVMFKGQPVPVGFINFMPDVTGGNRGEVRAFEIKDGVYNTADGSSPGIFPGPNKIMISGFNGKPKMPLWPRVYLHYSVPVLLVLLKGVRSGGRRWLWEENMQIHICDVCW